jgi:CO/xanthine dehydrogenase FAD-binding subunit
MKPPPFDYHAPSSVDETLSLLHELEDAKVLAGGQSLIPLLSLRLARPAHLVDVNRVAGLSGISADGSLTLGAMTRQREVERAAVVRERWPLLAAALEHVGHPPIRNRGTVGGSCAHADPAAELPAVMLALGASFVARSGSRGERTIGATEFFVSLFETSLEPDELLMQIRVPAAPARTGWSFQEVARRHGDFALVGAAALVTMNEDGTVAAGKLAFSGVGLVPVRADVLADQRATPDAIKAAAEEATASLEPSADVHGSSAYRKHLAAVVARRALTEAAGRA